MLKYLTEDVIHDINQGERRQGKDKFRAFNARMTHNYKEELKEPEIDALIKMVREFKK